MQASKSIRSVFSGASWLVPCAMLIGCSRGPSPNPPRAAMALTTVRSTSYTTAVPTGWEIHIPAGNILEAYDPAAPAVKNAASLQFAVQTDPGGCSGEKVKTTTDEACLSLKYERYAKVPSSIVEAQTSRYFLRIIHTVAPGERPVDSDEMKELALRILNQSAPPSTPMILAKPVTSPPTAHAGSKTAAAQ